MDANVKTDRFVGVDVQVSRGCPYAVLDSDGRSIAAGWLSSRESSVADALHAVLTQQADGDPRRVVVAIDAPRRPLQARRGWYWRGRRWQPCGPLDRGAGRHCEVVIAAYKLANPQWTPCRPPYPSWMELGFVLFESLRDRFQAFEVFPSASYRMLAKDEEMRIQISVGSLADGPKDMLDAYIAAATTLEFVQGRGCEVGGGDGFGSIVLPRRLPEPVSAVLGWPGQ